MRNEENRRVLYLDALRVISVAGVMMIHVSSKAAGNAGMGTGDWVSFVCCNCLGRFAVPVFFMISGSLMLDPDRDGSVRKLFERNIAHMVGTLFFWSFLYLLKDLLCDLYGEGQALQGPKEYVKQFLYGPTFLWFLFVLTGLYLIVPLLRPIVKEKRLMEYFLLLWMLFTMAGSFTTAVEWLEPGRELLRKFQMRFVYGYSGCFVLGYYLKNCFRPGRLFRRILYAAGIGAYLFTVGITCCLSLQKQDYVQTYLDGSMLNCLVMAAAIFVYGQNTWNRARPCAERWIHKIASCSFGMYLVHMLLLDWLVKTGFPDLWESAAIRIPAMVFVLYICSFIVAQLIRLLPGIGKKIT